MHAQAIRTAGLTDLDGRVLDAVAAYWCHHAERGYAVPLDYCRLGEATGAVPIAISAAIKRLVSLRLIGVQPAGRAGLFLWRGASRAFEMLHNGNSPHQFDQTKRAGT